MNPAQKALWFIESHLADALTLDEVAAIGGVSRFHMVRSFAAATGLSVMRYVRARRLSEAARALASGAPISSPSRWRRITALTKHSPARSATISE
jgi:AraC family transcriptional regulator